VDITDLNGETRSGSNTVSVGYKSLLLNITVPGGEQQLVDSFKHLLVNTTNLAGETVSSNVQVNVYELKAPGRIIRKRYWEQADTSVMSYSDYIKFFPHDEYKTSLTIVIGKKGSSCNLVALQRCR
jgi:hypothetical protein